ncbi:MAG: alpha-1,4-glucan--maltose-1-phosphate maltosyltransferase [Burkholderiales bacterium]|nr:alpha-1,4-glucan--maltose-1-phosphate maltosyltransferase [Burkholderiales bacterium]
MVERAKASARAATRPQPRARTRNPTAPQPALPAQGRIRAVIEAVSPAIDGGRFPIKRTLGEIVSVEADCFTDGHDVLACLLRWRHEAETEWHELAMDALPNDRWRGCFRIERLGRYRYGVVAWVDAFLSWQHDFRRRVDADDIRAAALAGAELVERAAARAPAGEAARLRVKAQALRAETDSVRLKDIALDPGLTVAALRHPDRSQQCVWPVELSVWAERERARYSTWYELFPRSAAGNARHGSFDDVIARLPYIAEMGFDVLYLPPIHPIGRTRRKGRNNALVAAADDVGSPWAIGAAEGGHTAIHPELGDLAAFHRLREAACGHGIELALDLAYQCSPDHPYVRAHPQWYRHRPDGSVQYAENPPKKYQDIYPFNFECEDWAGLWRELRAVLEFWLEQGIRIFRVDNPHTKAFSFWQWLIDDVKRAYPEAIFLAEAFTRPKVMHRLAKLGFSQSYTYFAWRNTKPELSGYFTELALGPGREYFRPNVWPNTPDILTEYLQFGGRPAFIARVVLAATLAASYGIYGPAFELMAAAAREPGSEEYLDSEKYQIRQWDLSRPDSLAELIARLNKARSDNPALQYDWGLHFHPTDNDALLCYSKSHEDNVVLAVVNLDPYHVQAGWTTLDLDRLGVDASAPFQMHELLSGARYLWRGARNYVQLDPGRAPAHVFRVRRKVRTERDFDYFL